MTEELELRVGMEFRMMALVVAMLLQTCLAITSSSPAGISFPKHSGVNRALSREEDLASGFCAFKDVSMRQACVHARMHACVAYI